MIELNDEILNKYIDGEFDFETTKKIKEQLEISHSDMSRYKTLLTIHNELRNIKVEEVSENFTQLLMKKLQKSTKAKKEQKYFIFSLSSIFLFGCLAIIGYLLFILFQTPVDASEPSVITHYTNEFINIVRKIFSVENISIIGSIMSFIMLATGYFFFDSLRHSKQK